MPTQFSWKQWWKNTFGRHRKLLAEDFDHSFEPLDTVQLRTSSVPSGGFKILAPLHSVRGTSGMPKRSEHQDALLQLSVPNQHPRAVSGPLSTEEFCAQLRQDSLDIDECIFEAASWQEQRKVTDWFEDRVDDLKQTGIIPKPNLYHYTVFTVSTAGAVAGWIAGGPVGSVIGSKSATLAVSAGFLLKDAAEKVVDKLTTVPEPDTDTELSQQCNANDKDSLATIMPSAKFEVEHKGKNDLVGTTMYPSLA